jgi:hypothetical protein
MPGSSPTMERRDPVRRLKRVDLPTLGRPTMAKTGSVADSADCGFLIFAGRVLRVAFFLVLKFLLLYGDAL